MYRRANAGVVPGRALIIAVGLGLALGACQRTSNEPLSTASHEHVALPPAPSLTRTIRPVHYAGGAFTVEGLLRGGAHTGQRVVVRGVVVELHPCKRPAADRPAAKSTEAPRSPKLKAQAAAKADHGADTTAVAQAPITCLREPFLYLADSMQSKRYRLLVAGWAADALDDMKPGRQLTLTGRFDVVTRDGAFIRQSGLLALPPGSRVGDGKGSR